MFIHFKIKLFPTITPEARGDNKPVAEHIFLHVNGYKTYHAIFLRLVIA